MTVLFMRVSLSLPFERLDLESLLQAEMMIYAIRQVNQGSPRALPNLTLGYEIFDTCRDVSFAIRGAIYLLDSHSPNTCVVPEKFQTPLWEPRAKAVIGEKHSEISVAIARVLALSSVAQVGLSANYLELSFTVWSSEDAQKYRFWVKQTSGVLCWNCQSVPTWTHPKH